MAQIRLSGQYGEEMAHAQGGALDHWGLLIEPVQTYQEMARARLQGGFLAVSQRFQNQNP